MVALVVSSGSLDFADFALEKWLIKVSCQVYIKLQNKMDTIADFLTIIRNGYLAKKDGVTANFSNYKGQLAKVLKDEGFIEDFAIVDGTPSKKINITLRYLDKNLPAVTGIKKVTKPSVRIYSAYGQIPKTLSGAGTTIVSTSQGLLTDKQAREKHLGGEIICKIW